MTLVVVCTLVAATLIWILFIYPPATSGSLRWALAALTQSMAAVLGLFILGLIFAIEQGNALQSRLRSLLPKYCRLLWGLDAPPEQEEAIAKLTTDCLAQTDESQLQDILCDPGGNPLRRFSTKKQMLLALSHLTYVACDHCNRSKRKQIFEEMFNRLRNLGVQEKACWSMVVDAPTTRSNPRDFFEFIDGVFHYLNEMVLSHPIGKQIVDRIWEETWYQDSVVEMLSSLRAFDFFRSSLFRITLILFVITIVGGILLLSGTSPKTLAGTPLKLAIAFIIILFVVSVGSLVIVAARLITNVPRRILIDREKH